MKKFFMLLGSSALILSGGLLIGTLNSCEGPAGPAGQDGQDASATCTQCHNGESDLLAKNLQYEASTHAMGSTFERTDAGCAPCHTNEGFHEVIASGVTSFADWEAASPDNPTPTSCRTCHNIHQAYDSTDWSLTTTEAFPALAVADKEIDLGTGNLCARCHQIRVAEPGLTMTAGPDSVMTSPYWGPHHGPQGNIMAGVSPYEFSGSMSYSNSAHTTMIDDGCVTCHMAEPTYGVQAGGHTMKMTYAYHGSDAVWQAGCVKCHTDEKALETKIEDTKSEIEGLITDLENALIARGALTASGSPNGKVSADEARAIVNYKMVEEDRSMGIHNYKYTKAILTNTLEALAQ